MCLTYPVSSRATCSYLFSLFEEWIEIEKRCGEESLGMLPLNLHAREEGSSAPHCSVRMRGEAQRGALSQLLKHCWVWFVPCAVTLQWHSYGDDPKHPALFQPVKPCTALPWCAAGAHPAGATGWDWHLPQLSLPQFKGQLQVTGGPGIFSLGKWGVRGGENPTEQLSRTTESNMKHKYFSLSK